MLLPVHILIVRITLGNYRVEPQSREAAIVARFTSKFEFSKAV